MEFNTASGFRSRRSYPNLHHVSLAPLAPQFPIDDELEPDYFSQHGDLKPAGSGTRTPPTPSYLSSVSVPSTPPILSHSRSASRTRHARSKSSTRAGPLSDTNLQSRDLALPLHHHYHHGAYKKRPSSSLARPGGAPPADNTKSDAEWMLRAGIALASSTREEKGQSWLSKRESSTSLVSEAHLDEASSPAHHRHHHRSRSGASSRKSRSGASTPAAYSRRSSRSRHGSRRGSRAGLAMTSMPPVSSAAAAGKVSSPGTRTGTASPMVVPDFVDERIRAEMASLQEGRVLGDEVDWDGDEDEDGSEYDYDSDETPEEFDEADLQRLTRERGFGLGSWIDRLVEWTLFGVDEWSASVSTAAAGTRIGATATTTAVTFEEPAVTRLESGELAHDSLSLASAEDDHGDHSDDVDALSHTDGDSGIVVEKPGAQGGWEDASWLFRVVKRALI
ncbi:uncharacterized protein N7459_009333 [Penicillium hispanicum]|uniref:uncharacterized protein n=1 Tax=Penicillium hispanicum TaxID=1080232 RepID=UPI00253F84E4|nr:uncharacterized protein N7459_009333 [Penicillium hispanicum]KAJ5569903.1 hypothetical protein N7459_009333 [Penicillium hispanicum]